MATEVRDPHIGAAPPLLLAGGMPLVCTAINMLTWLTAREVRARRDWHAAAQNTDTPAARLSSPGFANRLSATMVSRPHAHSAVAAHANSFLTEMVTYMKVRRYISRLLHSALTY
jgi:hypothetical protein